MYDFMIWTIVCFLAVLESIALLLGNVLVLNILKVHKLQQDLNRYMEFQNHFDFGNNLKTSNKIQTALSTPVNNGLPSPVAFPTQIPTT